MNIEKFSEQYRVKKLEEKDIEDILKICRENIIYYKHLNEDLTYEGIKEALTDLLPNKLYKDKYFVGFYKEDNLIAILDLINGYPNKETAYIGWFIMDIKIQGKGIGTELINSIIDYLKEVNFNSVELGCVKSNPQAKKFWVKNRFEEFGDEDAEKILNRKFIDSYTNKQVAKFTIYTEGKTPKDTIEEIILLYNNAK